MNWLPDGILPDKLLYETLKSLKDVKYEKVEGMLPRSLFLTSLVIQVVVTDPT